MPRWEKGKKYRHKNCLDIDIRIMSIIFLDNICIGMDVLYVSQRDPSMVFESGRIYIQRRDMNKWKQV